MSKKRALPKLMQAALDTLAAHGHGSSYELRHGLATLRGLVSRGLATERSGIGSMFSPRTAIKFHITDAGRAGASTSRGETP